MSRNLSQSKQIYTIEDWKRDAENVIQVLNNQLDQIQKELNEAKKLNVSTVEEYEKYISQIQSQEEEIERNNNTIQQLQMEYQESVKHFRFHLLIFSICSEKFPWLNTSKKLFLYLGPIEHERLSLNKIMPLFFILVTLSTLAI